LSALMTEVLMNKIYFRIVRNIAKNHAPSAEHLIGELPWLQVPSRDYLSELEIIMRAANDLDDNDH
jgi:hypothetical protein